MILLLLHDPGSDIFSPNVVLPSSEIHTSAIFQVVMLFMLSFTSRRLQSLDPNIDTTDSYSVFVFTVLGDSFANRCCCERPKTSASSASPDGGSVSSVIKGSSQLVACTSHYQRGDSIGISSTCIEYSEFCCCLVSWSAMEGLLQLRLMRGLGSLALCLQAAAVSARLGGYIFVGSGRHG
jgi:hypothetical protein